MRVKKIESHIHTHYSNDSVLNNYILLLICKIKKIDCLIITNHNNLKGIQKTKKYFEKHNIQIIPGEEIYTKDGEIIGLFINEEIPKGLSAKKTILEIKKQNGLVYIPHPYDEKRSKSVLNEKIIKENEKNIDCIEVHNGRNIKKEYSKKQKEISEKYNITPIVGSDAHTIFEIGRNYIMLNKESTLTRDNFIETIKNADFNCKPCINWIHNYTKIIKLLKLLLRGDLNGIYKIIRKKYQNKNK